MVIAVVLAALAALAVGIAVGWWMPPHGRTGGRLARQGDTRRILLPFSGEAISTRALDAAFRLARAEGATLMPAYLATVPRSLPLDAALPRQVGQALPVMEAVEQRASRRGIPTDCRVSRGRSRRDALQPARRRGAGRPHHRGRPAQRRSRVHAGGDRLAAGLRAGRGAGPAARARRPPGRDGRGRPRALLRLLPVLGGVAVLHSLSLFVRSDSRCALPGSSFRRSGWPRDRSGGRLWWGTVARWGGLL